jgi:hypothetical protein
MPNHPDHFIFFVDDFGTRTMCKPEDELPMAAHVFSFGLGGVIVPSEAVSELSERTTSFCKAWEVPELHGNKIRSGKGKFGFLKKNKNQEDIDRTARFFAELEDILIDPRIIAHACSICRPGYRDRYYAKHDTASRWHMSKTAFDISVERAAKYANSKGRRLSVVYERTGETEDRLIEGYFKRMKSFGTEFNIETSASHAPLSPDELSETLISIWPDGKSNPLLQLADLVVHPLCHRPTGLANRAYNRLEAANQLIDVQTDDPTIAVKYSCYDERYKVWEAPKNT